jgi:hypothetical protein
MNFEGRVVLITGSSVFQLTTAGSANPDPLVLLRQSNQ